VHANGLVIIVACTYHCASLIHKLSSPDLSHGFGESSEGKLREFLHVIWYYCDVVALCALLDTKLCWHWFLLKSHADYSVNIEHSVVSLLLHPVDVMSLCAQTFLPNILQN